MTGPDVDVCVVGGGPAGVSACLELAGSSDLNLAVFESDVELGGMPRSCHYFFGMRDQRRILTGPRYAERLSALVRKTSVAINTESHVLRITPGTEENDHQIEVLTPRGPESVTTRFIILAMGCSERSAEARLISSCRPAGIYTTGALQRLVNIYHQRPGAKAVVIGSEDVAFSSLITLKRAGVSIAGIIEEDPTVKVYGLVAEAMRRYYGCPIYRGTSLKTILGSERVEGVELASNGDEKPFQVECDTVIVTGKFRPDSQLIDGTAIARDPVTEGPLVDSNLMTSVPGVFAAGNILRGAQMHDLCALEGRAAARGVLRRLQAPQSIADDDITIRGESPIRYVVPQRISQVAARGRFFPWLYPGISLQVERNLTHGILEAWSGNKILWKRPFRKLIASNRVLLPVYHFDWTCLNSDREIVVRVRKAEP